VGGETGKTYNEPYHAAVNKLGLDLRLGASFYAGPWLEGVLVLKSI
jgi:hypothetical protein